MSQRGRLFIMWSLIAILSLQFLMTGTLRLSGQYLDIVFWGYSCSLVNLIGVADLLIAAGLIISRLRLLASIFLIISMCLQGYVYFVHEDLAQVMFNLASVGFAFIVIWYSKADNYSHW